jgi:GxxExxY protein
MMRSDKRIRDGYFNDLCRDILTGAIEVHRNLGPGLLESTYQKCLSHELSLRNISHVVEASLPVIYKGMDIECGYRIDILVEDSLILELKSAEQIHPIHEAQLLTYMKLAGIKHGFLINFNVQLLKDGIKSFVL